MFRLDTNTRRIYLFIVILISFVILSLLEFLLLIHTHCILGQGDLAFHFRRILELRTSILHGDLFPQFSFNQYHGSVIMTLYPYINLYPIALLSIFIKSKIVVLYIWYIINALLLFILSFYSSYFFSKSISISYLFSLFYCESTICFNVGLDDFGALTSFVFLPLVVFGCFNLVKNYKYLELSIGLSFIVFSHILSAIIAIIFVISWLLVNMRKIHLKTLFSLLKSGILVICITSLVWIPVVILKCMNRSVIFTPITPGHFVNGTNIIHIIGGDLINNLSLHPNIFIFVCIFIFCLFYKRFNSILRKLFWISLFFLIIGINLFKYSYSPHFIYLFFSIFQGPRRFFIIPQILLSYVFSVIIIKYFKFDSIKRIGIISISFVILFNIIFNMYNLIKSFQLINLIILILLIITLIILIQYNEHPSMHKLLLISVGLLVILLQVGEQQQVINEHYQQGNIITRSYFSKLVRHKRNALWLDRINKSNEFKYLLSFKSYPNYDYYPLPSLNKAYLINCNDAIDNQSNFIHVNRIGYNEFEFINKSKINKLVLPFLYYRGITNKFVYLKLDNHFISYKASKNDTISITRINKGKHRLNVYYTSPIILTLLKSILFIIGFVWIILIWIREMIEKEVE